MGGYCESEYDINWSTLTAPWPFTYQRTGSPQINSLPPLLKRRCYKDLVDGRVCLYTRGKARLYVGQCEAWARS